MHPGGQATPPPPPPVLPPPETDKLRTRVKQAEGQVRSARRRGAMLAAGSAVCLLVAAIVGGAWYAQRVLSYATLTDDATLARDDADPDVLVLEYHPRNAGRIGFAMAEQDRRTELLDSVAGEEAGREHRFRWRAGNIRPGDTIEVTSRDGLALVTHVLSVPNRTEKAVFGEGAVTGEVLSPGMKAGQIRAVLTWGKAPKDLDAHLEGPLPEGKQFHVYYLQKGDLASNEFVRLDIDAQNGEGPETITVLGVLPGTYRYWVHDYSNRDDPKSTALARSEAEVRVFQGGQTYRYRAGHEMVGNRWNVCTFEVAPTGAVVKKTDTYESTRLP